MMQAPPLRHRFPCLVLAAARQLQKEDVDIEMQSGSQLHLGQPRFQWGIFGAALPLIWRPLHVLYAHARSPPEVRPKQVQGRV